MFVCLVDLVITAVGTLNGLQQHQEAHQNDEGNTGLSEAEIGSAVVLPLFIRLFLFRLILFHFLLCDYSHV